METPNKEDFANPAISHLAAVATPPTSPADVHPAEEQYSVVRSASVKSDKNGRYRRTMEDTHVLQGQINGDQNLGLFCVFDGHGGRQAADHCADMVPRNLAEEMARNPNEDLLMTVTRVFVTTDEQMREKQIMVAGCTVVLAIIKRLPDGSRMLYCANAGDARAVVCNQKRGFRLTHDHKGTDDTESVRIREAGGFVAGGRVNGLLAVTRSLGDILMKDYVISTPFCTERRLEAEDKWLVLACDGIWDVLADDEVAIKLDELNNAEEAAEWLKVTALEKGSTDNITALAILL